MPAPRQLSNHKRPQLRSSTHYCILHSQALPSVPLQTAAARRACPRSGTGSRSQRPPAPPRPQSRPPAPQAHRLAAGWGAAASLQIAALQPTVWPVRPDGVWRGGEGGSSRGKGGWAGSMGRSHVPNVVPVCKTAPVTHARPAALAGGNDPSPFSTTSLKPLPLPTLSSGEARWPPRMRIEPAGRQAGRQAGRRLTRYQPSIDPVAQSIADRLHTSTYTAALPSFRMAAQKRSHSSKPQGQLRHNQDLSSMHKHRCRSQHNPASYSTQTSPDSTSPRTTGSS